MQPPFLAVSQSIHDSQLSTHVFMSSALPVSKGGGAIAFPNPVRTICPAVPIPEDGLHDKVRALHE